MMKLLLFHGSNYCSREPLRKGNRMQVILNLKILLHQDHIFGVNYLVVTLRLTPLNSLHPRRLP